MVRNTFDVTSGSLVIVVGGPRKLLGRGLAAAAYSSGSSAMPLRFARESTSAGPSGRPKIGPADSTSAATQWACSATTMTTPPITSQEAAQGLRTEEDVLLLRQARG
jgi:hypothetical protein